MGTRRWGEFLLHLRWGPVRPAGPDPTDGALLRRFADGRDEVAFALLVQRHGPTVFGVCCRILGPGPDAEDAFQATFVVLARRAAALADRAVVGNWLFGVARRTALKARAVAARRRAKERDMPRPESHPPNHAEELREAIDAAVAGLPTKYRAPVVLCELQGRSLREAAAELGWPEGTVAGRLSRGRAMLRARLVRAGLPAAAGVALTAPVPAALAAAAVRAGSAAAGGTGALPPAVAALAAGVQRQMAQARVLPIAATFGVVLAAAGAVALTEDSRNPPALPTVASATAPAAPAPPRQPPVDALGEPLPAGAVARFGDGRLRHGGPLSVLAFSADGRELVGGGRQWANQVWDVATGRHRRIVTADRMTSSAVALARDGSRLAACPDNTTCVIWDTAAGREIKRLTLPKAVSRAMAISPDGRMAVETGDTVVLFAPDGGVERELATPGVPDALVFSADGARLTSAELDGSVRVFDVGTGAVAHRLRAEPTCTAAAFGPVADTLVVGTNRSVWVFDLRTGTGARRIGSAARALVMAPDGELLATADFDGRVRLWDWQTGTAVRDVVTALGTRVLAFAPDGKTLAVGGAGQSVRLFDAATGRERLPADAPTVGVSALSLSADGRRLVTVAGNGYRTWDPVSGGRVARLEPPDPAPMLVAVSPDGTRVAGVAAGHRVRVWEPESGREVCVCDGPPARMHALAFAPDGVTLVGAYTADLRVWDPVTGETRAILRRHRAEPRSMAFGRTGPEVAVGYHDGSVGIWNPSTARLGLVVAAVPGGAYGVAYDPGRAILAHVAVGRVRVYDVQTMTERWSLPRPPEFESGPVALSPDGRWLAYADGPTVYLVDMETGAVARTYRGHVAAVTGLAFAPGSDRLYSASLDTTVLAWDVGPPAP
ncbi:MAG TPA: sigma-70 family RNA polymerase sigma factor [Gemmataceae bacterium]|nr:sigma-70 family RNA polymerase sigma factor [Gemmataceae bacterium]